jgi:hypothetical protein
MKRFTEGSCFHVETQFIASLREGHFLVLGRGFSSILIIFSCNYALYWLTSGVLLFARLKNILVLDMFVSGGSCSMIMTPSVF